MLYKKITKLITRSLFQDMVNFLNILLSNNGMSRYLSPSAIILGAPKPDYYNLRITFGAYSQVYIGTTNSNK